MKNIDLTKESLKTLGVHGLWENKLWKVNWQFLNYYHFQKLCTKKVKIKQNTLHNDCKESGLKSVDIEHKNAATGLKPTIISS